MLTLCALIMYTSAFAQSIEPSFNDNADNLTASALFIETNITLSRPTLIVDKQLKFVTPVIANNIDADPVAIVVATPQKVRLHTTASSKTLKWWPFLIMPTLLFGAYYLAEARRRKKNAANLITNTSIEAALPLNNNQSGFFNNIDLHNIERNINVDEITSMPVAKNQIKPTSFAINAANVGNNTFSFTQAMHEDADINHDILDHADVFLSIGRDNLAIALLQNHLIDYPTQSVTIWLFLLDLLAKDNQQTLYEKIAKDCKKYFNVKIPSFSNDIANTVVGLESFTRLTDGLAQVWGTKASLKFLDDLIYNTRLEARIGFAKNVMEELVLLRGIAQEAVKTAEIINLKEKKMLLREIKDAQQAAESVDKKSVKAQKLDGGQFNKKITKETGFEFEKTQQMFAFNLTEFK